jgi:hypothetical protein
VGGAVDRDARGAATVRRFLLWALERWTGDRYVRVSLVRDAHWAPDLRSVIDYAIDYANDHEASTP